MSNFKIVSYAVLGILIFSFNSAIDTNYLIRSYATLIEAQLGIIFIYFLMPNLFSKNKS